MMRNLAVLNYSIINTLLLLTFTNNNRLLRKERTTKELIVDNVASFRDSNFKTMNMMLWFLGWNSTWRKNDFHVVFVRRKIPEIWNIRQHSGTFATGGQWQEFIDWLDLHLALSLFSKYRKTSLSLDNNNNERTSKHGKSPSSILNRCSTRRQNQS